MSGPVRAGIEAGTGHGRDGSGDASGPECRIGFKNYGLQHVAGVNAVLPENEASSRATATEHRVVFVGNPNAGKTTLFNRLAGHRARTANYPGTTVEVRRARIAAGSGVVELVDLPGLYDLEHGSPEEVVASRYLHDVAGDGQVPAVVVVVLDATNLARNLSLLAQVRERVGSVVVSLNMRDLVAQRGLPMDAAALSAELGLPVFPLSARTGEGVAELREWVFSPPINNGTINANACNTVCPACGDCPYSARFRWAEDICRRTGHHYPETSTSGFTSWLDRWALHPLAGLALFAVIMAALFQSIFRLAEHPMDWIDGAFAGLADWSASTLPAGLWQSFLTDGVIAGIGGTVIFLPQICILFFLLVLLEDSGYLARGAVIVDRWMARVGLPGRAFVPMLSAHACAIPAILSAKAISDPRERLITIFILPLLTCTARLPVYALVTAMLFSDRPGMAGMVFTGAYFLGMLAAFLTAWLLKITFLRGPASPLMLELPDYRLPSLKTAFLTSYDRGLLFLRKAGTVILGISMVLWFLGSFPRVDSGAAQEAAASSQTLAQVQMEQSIIGRVGHAVQPVFEPLGFDWKLTIAVLTSFAAREVVASSLAVLHGLEADDAADLSLVERLRGEMTPATAMSLLVFFILAMQCLPTLAVVLRETESWKWPLLQFLWMSGLAYGAAWMTYNLVERLSG